VSDRDRGYKMKIEITKEQAILVTDALSYFEHTNSNNFTPEEAVYVKGSVESITKEILSAWARGIPMPKKN